MKRILVFSDTHGDIDLCIDVIKRIPSDIIIHTGDCSRDAEDLISIFPDKDIRYVKGNCDFYSHASDFEIIEADGIRIFAAHGHEQGVKSDPEYTRLANTALEKDCDMAVFGHTHSPFEGETNGIMLLNPGSAKYGFTYGIIETENGVAKTCVIDNSPF